MWSANDERYRSQRSGSRRNFDNSPYSDDEFNESERQYPDRGGNRELQWNRDDDSRSFGSSRGGEHRGGENRGGEHRGGNMFGRGNREDSYWQNQNRPNSERDSGNRGFDEGRYGGGQYGSSRNTRGEMNQGIDRDNSGQRGGYGASYGGEYGPDADDYGTSSDWGQARANRSSSWGQGSPQGGYGMGGSGGRGQQGMQQQWQSESRSQSHSGKGPKNWKRTDERLQDDVNEALARHHEIDASDIEVEVQNGELTLTGSVSDKQSKRLAEDVAESVFGVSSVENRIKVKRDNGRSNEESWTDNAQSSSARRSEKDVTRSAEKDRSQSSAAPSSGQTSPQADGADKGKKGSGAGSSPNAQAANIGG